MLNELLALGWDETSVYRDGPTINTVLINPELKNIALQIIVCLDKLPAMTRISLLDMHNTIDQEWADTEINIIEILSAAYHLNKEGH